MKIGEMVIQEWRNLLKDRRLFAILLLLPLGYMFLFGHLYSQDKVRNIPLLYIDQDNSGLSEQIIQGLAASETFSLAGTAHSEQELIDRVAAGEAYAGLIIPNQLSQKVTQNRQGELLTVIDGSNLIIANRVISGLNEVTQTYSQGITMKKLEAKGVDPQSRVAIQMGYRTLFNPGNSYSIYLLLGLMGTVLQSVTMLGMTLSLTGDKEQGQGPFVEKTFVQSLKYLYAKAVPYFLIGLFNAIVAAAVLTQVFQVPFAGVIWLLIPLAVAYMLSLIGFSFLVASVSQTKLQATQLTMLLVYPSFFLSGFSWPFTSMPQWVSAIGKMLPISPFLHGIRELAIKGNPWSFIVADVTRLALFASVTLLISLGPGLVERRKRYGV
ncbi:hypothetical protein BEP19_08895 [Ammoniphilus oxalaticus]|uniref:ABC transmembrane type-2 domain-containing protein n=1 Tax=Ammoniphilus oxalaticus TaxID=66863 RepID=A0A419SKC9_9BACL|nr:ABC transporter permease [Ammoniphilus oxalaticus]RKD24491.1 hypothetical protein BEP19_08895 [Ammoniphilus oxalaticus]